MGNKREEIGFWANMVPKSVPPGVPGALSKFALAAILWFFDLDVLEVFWCNLMYILNTNTAKKNAGRSWNASEKLKIAMGSRTSFR